MGKHIPLSRVLWKQQWDMKLGYQWSEFGQNEIRHQMPRVRDLMATLAIVYRRFLPL